LTELLVTLVLLGLVAVAVVPALWTVGQAWNRVDYHTEMLQNARRAADKIVRDLRAAQSFQQIDNTLLLFTTAADDGTGETRTVEYRLDTATSELEYRARAGYVFRRRITVTAGTAVPAGYSVSMVFDHAALVTAGRSLPSGDDVRIVHWTGSRWQELDRFNFSFTPTPRAWNTTAVRVWFRLQAPIAAAGSDNNYWLHYGDLSASPPPANGDHVFVDYEDGTTLAGWTRRDTFPGTKSASADGFVWNATSGAGYREFSKRTPAPHGNVEIIWGFRSDGPAPGASNRHVVGVSARRDGGGRGYRVEPGEGTNTLLRLRRVASWAGTGGSRATAPIVIIRGADYYGRFSLVGSHLRAKVWLATAAEPAWAITHTDTLAPPIRTGTHYGQVNGFGATAASPQNHRHRHVIVRLRVADPEPTVALAAEEAAPAPGAWQPLAGLFRAMNVQCFDSAGGTVPCPAVPGPAGATVRSVQVALTAMDPTGRVADFVVTSRAYRQAP
jgi:type II secretory pathway pseudopilin PulG